MSDVFWSDIVIVIYNFVYLLELLPVLNEYDTTLTIHDQGGACVLMLVKC